MEDASAQRSLEMSIAFNEQIYLFEFKAAKVDHWVVSETRRVEKR